LRSLQPLIKEATENLESAAPVVQETSATAHAVPSSFGVSTKTGGEISVHYDRIRATIETIQTTADSVARTSGRQETFKSSLGAMRQSLDHMRQELDKVHQPRNPPHITDDVLDEFRTFENGLQDVLDNVKQLRSVDSISETSLNEFFFSDNATLASSSNSVKLVQSLTTVHNADLHRRHNPSAESGVIHIQASARLRCLSTCKCQCHRFANMRTGGAVAKAVGSFFMRYNTVPVLGKGKCDNPKCRVNTPSSIQLNYVFPAWLIQTAISFSMQWGGLGGEKANCNLKVSRVLQSDHPVWWAIQHSSVTVFQAYLSERKIYPDDVDEDGSPLLTVSSPHGDHPSIDPAASSSLLISIIGGLEAQLGFG